MQTIASYKCDKTVSANFFSNNASMKHAICVQLFRNKSIQPRYGKLKGCGSTPGGEECIPIEDFHSSLIHFHWEGFLQQQNSICWPEITTGMCTVAYCAFVT